MKQGERISAPLDGDGAVTLEELGRVGGPIPRLVIFTPYVQGENGYRDYPAMSITLGPDATRSLYEFLKSYFTNGQP